MGIPICIPYQGGDPVAGADRDGGFVDDDGEVTIQAGADAAGGLGDVIQVGGAVFVGGGADGDEDDIGVGDVGLVVVGGEGQVIVGQGQHGFEVGFVDRRDALFEGVDFFGDEVQAGDLVAEVAKNDACVEADITCADDEYFHKFLRV